jgi:CCR4-NOT transcription complex subunit 4
VASQINTASHTHLTSTTTRQTRRGGSGTRQSRGVVTPHTDSRPPSTIARKAGPTSTRPPSQTSSSRPTTPASALLSQRPVTPADVRALRQKKDPHCSTTPPPCRSPTSSVAVESDLGSGSLDAVPVSPAIRPRSTESARSSSASVLSVPSLPPGLPAVPPGLPAPPGIPTPSTRPVRAETTSPQMPPTPIVTLQSSYQMSTAAKALLDDVKARWETTLTSTAASPFPDLDRTLETLSARDSGFSFNLDPKLAGDDVDNATTFLDFEVEASTPFHGSYLDAFPGLKSSSLPSTSFMAPPGLSYSHGPNRAIYDPSNARSLSIAPLEKQSTERSPYTGSFNPFADHADDTNSTLRKPQLSPLDDDCDRKVSRFGFAQGRKGSTVASSPHHAPSPLSNSDSHTSFHTSGEFPPTPAQAQWTPARQQHAEYGYPPPLSPLVHSVPAQTYSQQHSRFQPFESGVSDDQLRDLISSNRIHSGPSGMNFLYV